MHKRTNTIILCTENAFSIAHAIPRALQNEKIVMLYKRWGNGFVSIALTCFPNTHVCCDIFLLPSAFLLRSRHQAKTREKDWGLNSRNVWKDKTNMTSLLSCKLLRERDLLNCFWIQLEGLLFHLKDIRQKMIFTEDKYKSMHLLAHVRCQEHIQSFIWKMKFDSVCNMSIPSWMLFRNSAGFLQHFDLQCM